MEIQKANNPSIILIIEDDENMRDTLEIILKKQYRVLKAPDGETGLELVKKKRGKSDFIRHQAARYERP